MPDKKLPPPFDLVDHDQLRRHEVLFDLWKDCDLLALLNDANVLTQMITLRARRVTAELEARRAVQNGARHDCGEWRRDGRCALCGAPV